MEKGQTIDLPPQKDSISIFLAKRLVVFSMQSPEGYVTGRSVFFSLLVR